MGNLLSAVQFGSQVAAAAQPPPQQEDQQPPPPPAGHPILKAAVKALPDLLEAL